jgi:Heparinase II/III N-terminus/Heparinase II/III-like protein
MVKVPSDWVAILFIKSRAVSKKAFTKIRRVLLRPLYTYILFQSNTVSKSNLSLLDSDSSLLSLCVLYPKRIKNLLSSLDFSKKELKKLNHFRERTSCSYTCTTLLQVYQNKDSGSFSQKVVSGAGFLTVVHEQSLLDTDLIFQAVSSKVPLRDDGRLDWNYQGPYGDREWAWLLNRHYHLLDLFNVYQANGDLAYIQCLNKQLIDWIISSPCQGSHETWAQWRGLEAAFRSVHWSQIFYGLQAVDEFTPAARLLLLSSILDHAYYLRYLHSWGANWLIKEMYGLVTIALCWPEFKEAERWLSYAVTRILNDLPQQIYPDGAQKELTSHYHRAVLLDLQNLANLLTQFDRDVPDILALCLTRMWNYLAYSLRPDGYGALNNDSDRDDNRLCVSQAAETYQRPDWTYIATNGAAGVSPQGPPSHLFPWAGQVIMRSGWDANAHWAFFDIGPMGIYYHIHNDKLHLSIAAYGRDLLVDSGRYSYVRDKFWHYFRGSSSHNVILVDGQGQKADICESLRPMADHWAIEAKFDFSRGTFERGFARLKGKAQHTRAVVYLRGRYWVVVDQITTDRPRFIEPLWHFHPDCRVILEGDSATSVDPDLGNLRIIPCSMHSWSVRLVQGQEDPVQGWWSGTYNQKAPSPTVIYAAEIQQSVIFAWVLLPAQGRVPNPVVHLRPTPEGAIALSIQTAEQTEDIIAVRLSGIAPIDLGNGFSLDGECAILQADTPPLVAHGSIMDATGSVIAEHRGSSK